MIKFYDHSIKLVIGKKIDVRIGIGIRGIAASGSLSNIVKITETFIIFLGVFFFYF